VEFLKLLLVAHFVFILQKCNDKSNFISNEDNMQKNITLRVNQTYSIELENLGGAGYSWVVEGNNEKITSVKIEAGITAEDVKKMPVGGSIKVKVIIKAISEGTSHISLLQKRIWETNIAPIKKVELNVSVKK
jgi:predicted secreted protein